MMPINASITIGRLVGDLIRALARGFHFARGLRLPSSNTPTVSSSPLAVEAAIEIAARATPPMPGVSGTSRPP